MKKIVKDVILVAKHESGANTSVVNMQRAQTLFIIHILSNALQHCVALNSRSLLITQCSCVSVINVCRKNLPFIYLISDAENPQNWFLSAAIDHCPLG